jgi:hypothetical protein
MDDDKITNRREELFAPIQQQILMTDDQNDVLLLATNMFASSIHIFCQHYGLEAGMSLMQEILKNYRQQNQD